MFRPSIAIAALGSASVLAGAIYFASPNRAEACGCFAPPEPSVPIVQAGERILFGMEDGVVTAHIQVQYSGPAEEFGWLLPMPSVPEMTLGTDELFAQLTTTTQPKYALDATYVGNCPFDPNRSGGGFGASSDSEGGAAPSDEDGDSPLVYRSSVGPYDYAVLDATDKTAMFDWLSEEGFFVPDGTEAASDPYIRPGAYFLALKLLKGQEVGDLQPVVVKYESDLPMIPIILTSVAADPDMGVQVWVLGKHRAIPRNYRHTVINDAQLDWPGAGQNYVDVITDAVDEAEGHHSFVTEYAGTSEIMVDRLDPSWRFGNTAELEQLTDAVDYVSYLNANGYTQGVSQVTFQPTYSSQLLTILQRDLPVPQALIDEGVEPSDYYWNIQYYLGSYMEQFPEKFEDLDTEFDPHTLTGEIVERIVTPTREAGEMFRQYSYLSRLFTTLSPNEMTKDPVFSFNPDLPEVQNEHRGDITYYCNLVSDPQIDTTPAVVITENGLEIIYPNGTGGGASTDEIEMPFSLRIEQLREEGDPEVIVDNEDSILASLQSDGLGGCAVGGGSGAFAGLMVLLGLGLARRRRD